MTEESSAFGHLNSRESTPSVHKRTCGEKAVVFTLGTKLSGCSVAVSSPTTGSLRHAHFFSIGLYLPPSGELTAM